MTTLFEHAGGDEALHRHLQITDEQRERFVALYLEAADEADPPQDEAFREALRSHLDFGSHVAQQTPMP